MKNSRLIYTVGLMIIVIATLGLSSVRVLALLIEFDASALYYIHGATMPTTFTVGALVAVLIGLLFTVLLRSDLDGISLNSDSSVSVIFSALLGFIIIGCSIFSVISGVDGMSAIEIAALVMSVPVAVYFLIGIAMPVKSQGARTILAVTAIIWLFLKMIGSYFRRGVEINNPNKSLFLTAIAVTLIFIVAEGRFHVGTARRAFYVFAGFATVVVLGLYTLPNIVLIALRVYPDNIDLMSELTMLALFIYVLMRMCLISGMISDGYGADEEAEDAEEAEEAESGVMSEDPFAERKVRAHRRHRADEWDDGEPEYPGEDFGAGSASDADVEEEPDEPVEMPDESESLDETEPETPDETEPETPVETAPEPDAGTEQETHTETSSEPNAEASPEPHHVRMRRAKRDI